MTLELTLAVLGFLGIVVLMVMSIVDGLEIKRLKNVLNELYMSVAEDRIDIYKELDHIRDSYDVTQVELQLLAARCNQCEGCQCKKDSCPRELIPNKPKRPRKPKQ